MRATLEAMRREARKTGNVVKRLIEDREVTCTHVCEHNWHKWYWTLDGATINEPALDAALNIAEVEHGKA